MRRLLLVEDEYLVADGVRRELEALGVSVLGPAPDVATALELLAGDATLDGAILDINLGGEMVYPVAEALQRRGVAFAFWTGYEKLEVPRAFARQARWLKPAPVETVVRSLLQDATAALPPRDATALADVYLEPDGRHVLRIRAAGEAAEGEGLRWLGVAAIRTATWSALLRTPVQPGAFYRVPERCLTRLRTQFVVLG